METPHRAARTPPQIWYALRAHLVLIVVMALLGAAAGAAVALLMPRTYTATASVLVRPLVGNAFSPDGQGSDLTNLETEAQIVTSDQILDTVIAGLPGTIGKRNLANGVTVVVAPNTQILRVTAQRPQPGIAEDVSSALAEAYLDYRLERRDDYVDSRRASLQTRIEAIDAQLKELRRAGRSVDDPEMRSVAGQLLNLRLQLSTLESAESQPGDVIAVGRAKRSGLTIPLEVAVLGGLLLGVVAGVALALLRERRVGTLRTVAAVEDLGAPVLARRPGSADGTSSASPDDAALMVGAVMRRRLTQPAVVAVSGLGDDEGTSGFVADLAGVLAQGRQSVLLIDAHGSSPTPEAGLSEVLANPATLATVARRSADGYATLSVGKRPDSGQQSYATARMDEALQVAADNYDWVLVHGATLDDTLGRSIVAACAHWIPTVVLGRTTREDVEVGLAWAETTGTRTLGVVAVDASGPRRRRAQPEPASGVDD